MIVKYLLAGKGCSSAPLHLPPPPAAGVVSSPSPSCGALAWAAGEGTPPPNTSAAGRLHSQGGLGPSSRVCAASLSVPGAGGAPLAGSHDDNAAGPHTTPFASLLREDAGDEVPSGQLWSVSVTSLWHSGLVTGRLSRSQPQGLSRTRGEGRCCHRGRGGDFRAEVCVPGRRWPAQRWPGSSATGPRLGSAPSAAQRAPRAAFPESSRGQDRDGGWGPGCAGPTGARWLCLGLRDLGRGPHLGSQPALGPPSCSGCRALVSGQGRSPPYKVGDTNLNLGPDPAQASQSHGSF